MNEPITEPSVPKAKAFDMKYLILFGLSLLTVIILSLVIADYRTDKLEQEFNDKISSLEVASKQQLELKDEMMNNTYNEYVRVADENDLLRSQLDARAKPVERVVNIDEVNSAINSTATMLQSINQTKESMICAGKTYAVKIQGKYYCIRRSTGGGSGSSASVS